MRILFTLSLSVILSSVTAQTNDDTPQLVQLQVVTRHGSRFPLIRDSNLNEDESTGGITFLGQFQMYDMGEYITDIYNGEGFFDEFRNDLVRIESSATERTIVSADSMALGIWDEIARDPDTESNLPYIPANIPVYSRDLEDDVFLRAFDKCPRYLKQMNDLYKTDQWKSLEVQYSDILSKMGKSDIFGEIAKDGKIPLSNLWTAYDSINVARTECNEGTGACSAVFSADELIALLTDDEFARLEQLVQQVEQLRYSLDNSAQMIGGNLLNLITKRLDDGDRSFYLYSTHYPSFYGLFAGLGYSASQATIPSYAATIVFELLEDTQENYFVNVRYISNDSEDSEFVTIVPEGCPTDGAPCPWPTFRKLGEQYSVESWCRQCGNDSASECLKIAKASCSSDLNNPVFAGILIGLGLGAFALVVVVFMRKRRNRGANTTAGPLPPQVTTGPAEETAKDPEMVDADLNSIN